MKVVEFKRKIYKLTLAHAEILEAVKAISEDAVNRLRAENGKIVMIGLIFSVGIRGLFRIFKNFWERSPEKNCSKI